MTDANDADQPKVVPIDAWMDRAACKDADRKIFFPRDAWDETPDDPYPSKEASRYCRRCPVRAECLTHALALDLDGTWGDTTSYQRAQLKRPRARTMCPVCNSRNTATLDGVEMCLGCGTSWGTGRTIVTDRSPANGG